jgi:enoyl-CoA hydratase
MGVGRREGSSMSVVEIERPRGDVVVLRLNRPEKLNAIDRELLDGLWTAIAGIREDPECRVVILTGAGRGFCAGADLTQPDEAIAPGDERRGRLGRVWGMQEYLTGVAVALNSLRQPVIAAVNGPAVGGGLGFALACDLRVASTEARFGALFMKIGLSNCDVAVSYFLPRIVGAGRALELLLTARVIDAPEAERLGLVNRVVPPERLLPSAIELAGEIAANSEFGVWMTKEGVWANIDAPSLQHAVQLEYRTQMVGVYGDNMAEAFAAFREKRPPSWEPV